MIRSICLFTALLSFSVSIAQSEEKEIEYTDFTYHSDRAFYHPKDFDGYTFLPRVYERDGYAREIGLGQVTIHFASRTLFIEGVPQLESYNILSFRKFKDGYIIEIVDVITTADKGWVTIYLDDYAFVRKITIETEEHGEHTFGLAIRSKSADIQLNSEFTNTWEWPATGYDTLVGATLLPFLQVPDIFERFELKRVEHAGDVSFELGEQTISIKTEEESTQYDIKSVTEYKRNTGGRIGNLRYLTELKLKPQSGGKKAVLYIYINQYDQIDYLEFGNSRFYLKP